MLEPIEDTESQFHKELHLETIHGRVNPESDVMGDPNEPNDNKSSDEFDKKLEWDGS